MAATASPLDGRRIYAHARAASFVYQAVLRGELTRALVETAAGRSVILIVHRLMGVERLDRIWRLADGQARAAA